MVRLTKNISAIKPQLRRDNEDTKQKSNEYLYYLAHMGIPTYLAFFQKKEDEESTPEPSLIKKKPVDDETTPEGKLKTTLKRTILAIRRKEFDKAEQMAHLALRMAQDINSYDGITLCYDIMANLALDREQYQKAQQLFESVLQRLLQKGVSQDDIQVRNI